MNDLTPTMKKIIILLLLALVPLTAGILIANWSPSPDTKQPTQISQITPPTSEPTPEVTQEAQQENEVITLTAVNSQNALDLLQENTNVETEEFAGMGTMVKAINGLAADAQHYWGIYINGEYAQQGIAATQLEAGDQLQLRYETIEAAQL